MDEDGWRRLFDKGAKLYNEYEREGNPAHVAEAIVNFQEALALCPPGLAKRSRTLHYLARALQTRYELEGNAGDVSLSITLYQEALSLRPVGDSNRSDTLNNLGNALGDRYDREGNVGDLSLSIVYHQEALSLRPVGDFNRWSTLNSLGNVLSDRYGREGNADDLSLSITYLQEALSLCPVGDLNRWCTLNSLGIVLQDRYKREGNADDLSLAIMYHQEALSLHPVGDPNRWFTLNNLGFVLVDRYNREGNAVDLSLSIECHHEALNLRPSGHPNRYTSCMNLGFALWTQYEGESRSDDHLAQAITYLQEALEFMPARYHHRSLSIHCLANALKTRCERKGDLNDLSNAIMYHQECLDLRPPGHPNRSETLRHLAASLWLIRCQQKGGGNHSVDLDVHGPQAQEGASRLFEPVEHSPIVHPVPDSSTGGIISLLQEASQSENCSSRDRLWATLDWIKYSRIIDPNSTMEAYSIAFRQLDVVLALGQSLEHRQDRLLSDKLMVRARGLGDEAATWALQQGEPERAVEFLEQGRSLLLAQLGRYRTELADLRDVDFELATRFESLSRRLNLSLVSNPQFEETSSTTSDPYERYRQVSTEWNATIDKIRTLPNFETFLEPPPYRELRKAATEGPIIILIPNENGSNALIVREHAPIHLVHLPLANSGRLTELSNNILLSLEADDPTAEDMDADNRTEGLCLANVKSLWNEVVGPIARALQFELGVPLHSRVWWCPTSMMSFLPLHAAGLYLQGKPGENFPNLYTSSYTPTLNALLRGRRDASRNALKRVLIDAQPVNPNQAPVGCTGEGAASIQNIMPPTQDVELPSAGTGARRDTRSSERKKLLIVAQPATPGKPLLRYAMEEAAVIERMVSPTQGVKMLSAEAGTCDAVQHQMESHPWVHFICHGIQDEHEPLNSYLALHDGSLTLRMIIQQNLPNAELAFLSACHSAAGDKVLANEALHLAAAMQFAGFRGVIGTLWEMADKNGPPLTETFYREMAKHGDSRGAAKALSKAIRQLRRTGVPLNRWMRFVHIGI